MNASVFNIHDLIHIITSVGALLLCLSLITIQRNIAFPTKFLAGFFLSGSVWGLANLFLRHSLLRQFSMDHSAIVTSTYVVASLSIGAFLYFFVLSILDDAFVLSRRHILHLLASPMAALFVVSCGFGVLNIAGGTPFQSMKVTSYSLSALLKYVPWCYALFCFRALSQGIAESRQIKSIVPGVGLSWIQLLIYSFVISCSWRLFTQLFSGYLGSLLVGGLPNVFGLIASYLEFSLLLCLYAYGAKLVFESISVVIVPVDGSAMSLIVGEQAPPELFDRLVSVEPVGQDLEETHLPSTGSIIANQAAEFSEYPACEMISDLKVCGRKIVEAMATKNIYLDHAINLDRFAERIGEHPKNVSHTLNADFKIGFFELLNDYRVEAAKRFLQEKNEFSINEVIEKSGFRSKSAFHRSFKAATGKTAGQFRRENSAVSQSEYRQRLAVGA